MNRKSAVNGPTIYILSTWKSTFYPHVLNDPFSPKTDRADQLSANYVGTRAAIKFGSVLIAETPAPISTLMGDGTNFR
jgi:hypothetical protein